MALFRRKPIDPARAAVLRGFEPIGDAVEAAQQALLRAVPTFRDDGIAIGFALAAFTEHLDHAERALAHWDVSPDIAARCGEAIEAAREEATKLRLETNALVFEALNGRIGDILFPLETVADIETELRETLRRSRP